MRRRAGRGRPRLSTIQAEFGEDVEELSTMKPPPGASLMRVSPVEGLEGLSRMRKALPWMLSASISVSNVPVALRVMRMVAAAAAATGV